MDILLWHEILEPYELAVKELQVKFRHLIKEHHGKGLYSPIESVSGRVKSVSSILEGYQPNEQKRAGKKMEKRGTASCKRGGFSIQYLETVCAR